MRARAVAATVTVDDIPDSREGQLTSMANWVVIAATDWPPIPLRQYHVRERRVQA